MLCFHHTVTAYTWIRVSLPSSVDSCRPLPSPCISPDSLLSRQPLWTILLKCELDDFRLLPAGQPAIARHLAQSRKPVTFAHVALCPSYLSVLDPYLPVLSPLRPPLTSAPASALSDPSTYQNAPIFSVHCFLCLDHHPAAIEGLPPSPPWALPSDDTFLIIPIQTTVFKISTSTRSPHPTPPRFVPFSLPVSPSLPNLLCSFHSMLIAHLSHSKT